MSFFESCPLSCFLETESNSVSWSSQARLDFCQRVPEVLCLQFPQCLAFHVGAGDGAWVCTLRMSRLASPNPGRVRMHSCARSQEEGAKDHVLESTCDPSNYLPSSVSSSTLSRTSQAIFDPSFQPWKKKGTPSCSRLLFPQFVSFPLGQRSHSLPDKLAMG